MRYTEAAELFKLAKGKNKVRFYAASRENVLEKIIIKKKQEEVVTKIIYS